MTRIKDTVRRRMGQMVRPDREFGDLRDIAERRRSPTWQITIALIASTVGAAALGYLAIQLFFLPDTIREARLNRVPDLTGATIEDAVARGEEAGYVVAVVGREYSDEVQRGEVIYQDPPPDMYLPRGDTLEVLASLGEASERIPDVTGLELDLARQVFAGLDLGVASVRREASDESPQGTVIRTEPAAGTPTERGEGGAAAVTLVISRGGSRLTMPNVRGLTLAAARDSLELYSLTVGGVTGLGEGEVTAAEGARIVVVGQEPRAGWLVPAGSAVALTLGQGTPRPSDVEAPPARQPLPEPPERVPQNGEPEGETPSESVETPP